MTASERSKRLELLADGTLSIEEGCELSGLSRSELYDRMTAGDLAYVKHGRRRLVVKRSLLEMLESGLVTTV